MNVIVAFSFGRIDDAPNLSSAAIAELVAYAAHLSPYIIIAQWEVAKSLKELGVDADHVVSMKPEGYLSSLDVALSACQYLTKCGITPVQIFAAAHPDHVARCVRCLRNVGLPGAQELTDPQIPYDPSSTEVWVRSRKLFLFRELLAMPIYALRNELR